MDAKQIKECLTRLSEYVKKHYDELEESVFDDTKCVVVLVTADKNWGWGHHSFSGIGITRTGEYTECSSSGCSCSGSVDISLSSIDNLCKFNGAEAERIAFDVKTDGEERVAKKAEYYSFGNY